VLPEGKTLFSGKLWVAIAKRKKSSYNEKGAGNYSQEEKYFFACARKNL
jgi:hypothetical protein